MKKFALSLALIGALGFGATAANAASIKATGAWQIDASWLNQMDFDKTNKDDNFSVTQRIRTGFQFIANENLKGVLETQIGTNAWGNGQYQIGAGRTASTATGGANTMGNGSLVLRKAYLDFKVPTTKINILAGYQSLALPSALGGGSAIMDDHMAGIAAVVPITDGFSLVGGYARPYDMNTSGSASTNSGVSGEAFDASFLYANIEGTGFKVQPFVAYAYASGTQVQSYAGVDDSKPMGLWAASVNPGGSRAYWAGAAFTVSILDPFTIKGDLNYGHASTSDFTTAAGSSRAGWLGDIAVDYTGLSMMTPELFFAYSTGDKDGNGATSGRMPVASGENWAYGTFWMQGGDALIANNTNPSQNMGFWALGLSLKDIKLIDKLSHTVHFIYFKGTNDKDSAVNLAGTGPTKSGYGNVLTEKDSLFEVDLNSKYQLYDELSLGLELGYINANFDKGVWSSATGKNGSDLSKDAYKAALMMNYSF
ncbi:MAG: hypothetical protein AUJ49_11435 [Desulfovibrionaceae bacterium CG1_02_65_16]|nr:MAG: hypothetical protein AUJ49_11435 [Desulfovibrionaceae bacterium CG1_02_65_16]